MSDQFPRVGPPGPTAKAGPGKPAAPQARDLEPGEGAFRQMVDSQARARAEQAARLAGLQAPTAPAGEIKFSAHAQQRMKTRGITLNAMEMDQIRSAVSKAAAKGARESLVLINNKALVVSVPNRTVITAVDEGSLKENVFTNIDSAVIL